MPTYHNNYIECKEIEFNEDNKQGKAPWRDVFQRTLRRFRKRGHEEKEATRMAERWIDRQIWREKEFANSKHYDYDLHYRIACLECEVEDLTDEYKAAYNSGLKGWEYKYLDKLDKEIELNETRKDQPAAERKRGEKRRFLQERGRGFDKSFFS